MDQHTYRVLEWPLIVDALAGFATSTWGHDRCRKIEVFDGAARISHELRLTSEARDLLEIGAQFPLGGIRDPRASLVRLRQDATLNGPSLLEIADTLVAAKRMKHFLEERSDVCEALFELSEPIQPLDPLHTEIHRCFDASGEVADAASPELSHVRAKVKQLNSSLRERLQHLVHSLGSALQEPIVTIRRDRFVLPVRADSKSQVPGLVHDQSASGATLYVEPLAVVDMNNNLSQARMQESKEVEKVLMRLSELAARYADEIEYTCAALAEIDFVHAKARLSLKLGGVSPRLDENGHTRIYGARHPLLALNGRVVPIDLELGGKASTLLITGPNTGGKTVTLKTLGLVTLMTQAGLHPSVGENSQVGIFADIFADIGDEQSIAQSLSTFSGHLKNLVSILAEVDHRCLVLLDELGAGTDPSEGVVLARAVLEALQNRGAKTVATTHYGELKRLAFTSDGIENASVEFDNETLSPTFRLLMGVPGQSNAINIAKKLGLQDEVIVRALELAEHGIQDSTRLIQHLEEEKIQAILAHREAEEARVHARQLEEEYEKKLETWQEEKNRLREAALKDIGSEMKQAKEEISSTIRELQSSRSGQAAQKAQSKMAKIYQRIQAQEKKPKAVKKELQIGDLVFLEKLGQNAAIVSLPDALGNLSLQIGSMKISANLKEISPLKEIQNKSRPGKALNRMREAVLAPAPVYSGRQASLECDLRGRMAEDALFELEQYLDTAYGNDVKTVTVIHGAGTGVLRKRIREYLKDSPYAASFRPGEIGEGGDGVTVVNLS